MNVKFTVYGKPQHKRRVRSQYLPGKNGKRGFIKHYMDSAEQDAETTISAVAIAHRPEKLLEGPLRAEIVAFFPIPKSKSKKEKSLMKAGLIRPEVKPDFDNIAKIYCDSLNGILFADDKSIVDGRAVKFYSDVPRVVFEIWELEEDELLRLKREFAPFMDDELLRLKREFAPFMDDDIVKNGSFEQSPLSGEEIAAPDDISVDRVFL